MHTHRLTPILNVSDMQESFAWFEKLGWKKSWDWGTLRPSAASVPVSVTSSCA